MDNQRIPQVEFHTDELSGATLLKETDYVGEGQFPLSFTRYFTSPNYTCGQNQPDWIHNYSSCLISRLNRAPAIDENRSITVCTLGSCTTFEDNLKPRLASVRDTLVQNGSINGATYAWVYTQFKTGMREAYGSNLLLLARFDRSGIEHRVTYDASGRVNSITHIPSGRKLSIAYLPGGSGSRMTDPYFYDWMNSINAASVSFPNVLTKGTGLVRNYAFKTVPNCNGEIRLLSKITESDQVLLEVDPGITPICVPGEIDNGITLSYGYQNINFAGHNAKPLVSNRQFKFTSQPWYLFPSLTEQFSDTDTSSYRSFSVDRPFVNTNNGRLVTNQHAEKLNYGIFRPATVSARCAACNNDYQSYTYDPVTGDLLTRTDYLGRVTKFTNDARGLPLTQIEAFGTVEARGTAFAWDPRFPLKTLESRGSVTHEWRYNGQGHLIKEITRPPSEALVNDSCPVASTTCHQTGYSYTYDPGTKVITKVIRNGPRPENGPTVAEYRPNGDLWKMTNAKGQVSEVIAVNAHGQITDQTDINARPTHTIYNNLRQPMTISVGGDLSKFDYYPNGRLKTLTRPDNTVLSYTHAGSIQTISKTANLVTDKIEYKRDSRGNRLETISSRSNDAVIQHTFEDFDDTGRRINSRDGNGTWFIDQGYNANNLLKQSCPGNEICDVTDYTALDQVNGKSIAPVLSNGALGTATPLFDLWYDKAGRVNKVIDPNSATNLLFSNEVNGHTSETSPDFGVRTAQFDLAGNEYYHIDKDNNAATRQYDKLDRLYRTDYSDGGNLNLKWDVPTIIGENPDNYVGRLARRARLDIAPEGNLTVTEDFRYNARGDILRNVQAITNLSTLTTNTSVYLDSDGTGRPNTITYPNNVAVKYTYGDDDRATEMTAVLGGQSYTLATQITWQPLAARLAGLRFGNGLSYERKRDVGGRLSAINLLNGGTAVYIANIRYDSRNRVSYYNGKTFKYDDLNHLSDQLDSTGPHTALHHDLNGNLDLLEKYDATGALISRNVLGT